MSVRSKYINTLRIIQGPQGEVVDDHPSSRRGESAVDHDNMLSLAFWGFLSAGAIGSLMKDH
jgi:hypothetical protein